MLVAPMTTIDLTGAWQGHYVQNRGRHGIAMRVVQRGQSFVGAMRDTDTLLAGRAVVRAPAADAAAAPAVVGEAEVLSSLPEHSTVEGEIEGRIVTFVKTYRGNSSLDVWVPGRPPGKVEVKGHQVHYRGTLAADRDELTGYWTITPARGGPRLRGAFVLRRVARAASP